MNDHRFQLSEKEHKFLRRFKTHIKNIHYNYYSAILEYIVAIIAIILSIYFKKNDLLVITIIFIAFGSITLFVTIGFKKLYNIIIKLEKQIQNKDAKIKMQKQK